MFFPSRRFTRDANSISMDSSHDNVPFTHIVQRINTCHTLYNYVIVTYIYIILIIHFDTDTVLGDSFGTEHCWFFVGVVDMQHVWVHLQTDLLSVLYLHFLNHNSAVSRFLIGLDHRGECWPKWQSRQWLWRHQPIRLREIYRQSFLFFRRAIVPNFLVNFFKYRDITN